MPTEYEYELENDIADEIVEMEKFEKTHLCEKSKDKMVAIEVDEFGNTFCGYCGKQIDYNQVVCIGEDISLCPKCNCMTKTIIEKGNLKYCGKCGGKKNGY